MKRPYLFPLVMAGTLALTGCFDSSSTSDVFEDSNVRLIHAVPDAPTVNVTVDGEVAAEAVDYKGVALLEQDTGTSSVAIDAVLPEGTETILGPLDLDVEDDTRYEVIAVGSAADGSLETLVFPYSDESFDSDTNTQFRVVHLAEGAGEVDVYLSDPEDEAFAVSEAEANLTLSYTELAEPVDVPEGDYRIQVTAAGDDEVVFDSGTISLDAGDDLLLGAVTNTGANAEASPISLMVVNGADVTDIYDTEQQAGVRVVHNAADAGNVDVYLNDELSDITDLAFLAIEPDQDGENRYVPLPAGTVDVQIPPAGQAVGDAVMGTELDLMNGQGYTVIASGLGDDLEAQVLEDNQRSIATQASLRVVHGATQAGNVDVYLLGRGDDIGNAEPTLTDVALRDVSDYLAVAPGDYDIVVAVNGDETVRSEVELEAGRVYTAIARDQEEGGVPADELILLADFTATTGIAFDEEAEAVGDEVDEAADEATDEAEETIDDIIDEAEEEFEDTVE